MFKSIQFLLKLQTNPYDAVCYGPKITSLLTNDFPKDIQSNLEYNLDKYCAGMNFNPVNRAAQSILSQFDFLKVKIFFFFNL